ncbi:MAG: peptidylprolyl isomerase [Microcoleaceae cyanobacterium]
MTYFTDLGLTPLTGDITVEMIINDNVIKMQIDGLDAPVTAANFVDLVERGIYNATKFHRLEPGFVAQGGDPQSKDPTVSEELLGTGGFIDSATDQERNIPLEIKPVGADEPIYSKTFAEAEITAEPFLPHSKGAIAMARTNDPDTASSQFYFALDDLPQLDGSYAVFGAVTEGMSVVENIAKGDAIQYLAVTEGSIANRQSALVTDFELLNSFINDTNTTKIEYTLVMAKSGEIQDDTSSLGEIETETDNKTSDEIITEEKDNSLIIDDVDDQLDDIEADTKTDNQTSDPITNNNEELLDGNTIIAETDNNTTEIEDPLIDEELIDDDADTTATEDLIADADSITGSDDTEELIGDDAEDDLDSDTTETEIPVIDDTDSITDSDNTEELIGDDAEDDLDSDTTETEIPVIDDDADEDGLDDNITDPALRSAINPEETTTNENQDQGTDDSSITAQLSPEDQAFVNTLLEQTNNTGTREASDHDSTNTTETTTDSTNTINDPITTRTAAIMALGGNDQIQGTNNNDVINGNSGDDDILGADGHDFLRGGKGNDKVSGGLGKDFLVGDYGIDTLTGNEGIDNFILRASTEQGVTSQDLADVIADFSLTDGDRISVIADFITETDLVYEASGNDTILKLGTTGDILALVKGATQSMIEQNISIIGTDDIALTRIG